MRSPAELGEQFGTEFGESHAPYPAEPLTITAPGEESGTYDSFVDLVFGDIAEARKQDAVMQPDYQASPDDNVIIEGVAGTADAPSTSATSGSPTRSRTPIAFSCSRWMAATAARPATEDTHRGGRVPDLAVPVHLPRTWPRGRRAGSGRPSSTSTSPMRGSPPSRRGLRPARRRRPGSHALSVGRPLTASGFLPPRGRAPPGARPFPSTIEEPRVTTPMTAVPTRGPDPFASKTCGSGLGAASVKASSGTRSRFPPWRRS